MPTLLADAYTVEAVAEAWGLSISVVRTVIADGPRAVPMRPRISVTRKGRGELTTCYVWGPDAMVLLAHLRTQ